MTSQSLHAKTKKFPPTKASKFVNLPSNPHFTTIAMYIDLLEKFNAGDWVSLRDHLLNICDEISDEPVSTTFAYVNEGLTIDYGSGTDDLLAYWFAYMSVFPDGMFFLEDVQVRQLPPDNHPVLISNYTFTGTSIFDRKLGEVNDGVMSLNPDYFLGIYDPETLSKDVMIKKVTLTMPLNPTLDKIRGFHFCCSSFDLTD